MAIGNTWIYLVVKWSVDSSYTKWEITEIKSIPMAFPDSSEVVRNIFLCRVTEKYNTNPDSAYIGFYKELDGIVLVDLNEDITKAFYFEKILNEPKVGWYDTISPGFIVMGTVLVQTLAGTFNCNKLIAGSTVVSYFCRGVGLVANLNNSTETILYSYELKE